MFACRYMVAEGVRARRSRDELVTPGHKVRLGECTAASDPSALATPLLALAATLTDLEDWGALEEAIGPEMHTSGVELWSDGAQSAGVWRCTPGPSRWDFTDVAEFIHVLEGSMTVTRDGGEATAAKAGDVVVFPKGWAGTWEIHETLTKAYVTF
ncbi:MAG: uncharacterized protein QOH30_4222 [Baekduia sp.]|jgi:uncharacterized cupin superfamily protein|nr:uncharacterized protein [Baekduia sp.]